MKTLKHLIMSIFFVFTNLITYSLDYQEYLARLPFNITIQIDDIVSTKENDISNCSATYNHVTFHGNCGCDPEPRCEINCQSYPSTTTSTSTISHLPSTLQLDHSLSNFSISYKGKTFKLPESQLSTLKNSPSGGTIHLDTKTGQCTITLHKKAQRVNSPTKNPKSSGKTETQSDILISKIKETQQNNIQAAITFSSLSSTKNDDNPTLISELQNLLNQEQSILSQAQLKIKKLREQQYLLTHKISPAK